MNDEHLGRRSRTEAQLHDSGTWRPRATHASLQNPQPKEYLALPSRGAGQPDVADDRGMQLNQAKNILSWVACVGPSTLGPPNLRLSARVCAPPSSILQSLETTCSWRIGPLQAAPPFVDYSRRELGHDYARNRIASIAAQSAASWSGVHSFANFSRMDSGRKSSTSFKGAAKRTA
jgi:hypothetical protein